MKKITRGKSSNTGNGRVRSATTSKTNWVARLLATTALVSAAQAATIVVNTDLGWIDGVASGGTFNGTQFVVNILSDGTKQFVFNGDLNVGIGDTVRGVGSSFASFVALNNANINGATFDFSAVGQAAGPGGGSGGSGFAGGNAGGGSPFAGFGGSPGGAGGAGGAAGDGGTTKAGRPGGNGPKAALAEEVTWAAVAPTDRAAPAAAWA